MMSNRQWRLTGFAPSLYMPNQMARRRQLALPFRPAARRARGRRSQAEERQGRREPLDGRRSRDRSPSTSPCAWRGTSTTCAASARSRCRASAGKAATRFGVGIVRSPCKATTCTSSSRPRRPRRCATRDARLLESASPGPQRDDASPRPASSATAFMRARSVRPPKCAAPSPYVRNNHRKHMAEARQAASARTAVDAFASGREARAREAAHVALARHATPAVSGSIRFALRHLR